MVLFTPFVSLSCLDDPTPLYRHFKNKMSWGLGGRIEDPWRIFSAYDIEVELLLVEDVVTFVVDGAAVASSPWILLTRSATLPLMY